MTFSSKMTIHFDDADPAGICFFAKIIGKSHHIYEEFIAHIKEDPVHFFSGEKWLVPIRHVEADYFAPLRALNTYPVFVSVTTLSRCSFQLQFAIGSSIGNSSGQSPNAMVKTTHVFVDRASQKKAPLPPSLRQKLEAFL